MAVTVTIDANRLIANLTRLTPLLEAEIKSAFKESALAVENRAKQDHAYTDRTQALTGSIGGSGDAVSGDFLSGFELEVLADIEYAPAIEGGRKAKYVHDRGSLAATGYRFMANALDAERDTFKNNVRDAVDLAILKAGLG